MCVINLASADDDDRCWSKMFHIFLGRFFSPNVRKTNAVCQTCSLPVHIHHPAVCFLILMLTLSLSFSMLLIRHPVSVSHGVTVVCLPFYVLKFMKLYFASGIVGVYIVTKNCCVRNIYVCGVRYTMFYECVKTSIAMPCLFISEKDGMPSHFCAKANVPINVQCALQ